MNNIMDRRDFLRVVSTTGSGLVLGLYLPYTNKLNGKTKAATIFEPNVWIKVHPDNSVLIMVGKSEMGQGVLTSLPMIIAEEMDLDWSTVKVQQAPADKDKYGSQMTGGSRSIASSWKKLRKAGATAREMMISAAAKEWGVPAGDCMTKASYVIHNMSNRKMSYGSLTEKASQVPVPRRVSLKNPKKFSIIGKNIKRKDTQPKLNGKAQFSMDVQLEGMVYATVVRSPVFGGKLKSFDEASVSDIQGVIKIFEIEDGLAIVARSIWVAIKAGKKLKITWDKGENDSLDSNKIKKLLVEKSKKQGAIAHKKGNVKKAIKSSDNQVEAVYESPFQAHATMEPMNCTADVQKNKCRIWAATQAPARAQKKAAKITGLPIKKVELNVTYLGGGFGRRSMNDFVNDAVEISMVMEKPVKMVWTREEDMQHDYYRPTSLHVMKGAIDNENHLTAWTHRVVAPSILFSQLVKMPFPFKEKLDIISVEGAKNIRYDIPNILVDYRMANTPVPVGWWRSVYDSQNAFANECFMDELAEAAGKDPVEFRLELLPKSSRERNVLNLVAKKANWKTFNSESYYQGVSFHKSFGTYVAQVARVSVKDNIIKVGEIHCAVDCGIVINPSIVEAQISGAIIYGLSAALKSKITVSNGRIDQSNFDDFDVLRMDETPKIHVYLIESDAAPTGVGEPGLPPAAPAVANAVYAATGKRIRRLPITIQDIN